MPHPVANLLIVSHVMHFRHAGRLYAYGPYAREIDIWADLFPEVTIAAPLRSEKPPRDCVAFTRTNIEIARQWETGGDTVGAKLWQLILLPFICIRLAMAMRGRDAIHVRCPGNLGLVGALLAPLFCRRLVAKYAGQWNGFHGEQLAVRWQRSILRSRWWRHGVVTVYGEWPAQPAQIVPFFTSMMTDEQVRESALIAMRKSLSRPVQILFSGRLATAKCVDVLLRAAAIWQREELDFHLNILGDGPERVRLEQLTRELALEGRVTFLGAVPFDQAMQWHALSHLLVLPSAHSEGWPKVLAEAMCHGVVCVGTDHGLLPWMLKGRGLVFPVGDVAALARMVSELTNHADEYARLSAASAAWAQSFSLEGLRDELAQLLSQRWAVTLEPATHRNFQTAGART